MYTSSTGRWIRTLHRYTSDAILVAAGATNREAADRLFISPRTVDKHVERLLAVAAGRRVVAGDGLLEQHVLRPEVAVADDDVLRGRHGLHAVVGV